MKLLERLWRSAATVFCFGTFAAGGLLMGLLVIPPLRLLVRDPAARRRLGKRVVQWGFRFFVAQMEWTGPIRVTADPALKARLARGGDFVVANHPTLIDFVVLGAYCPRADCLVKAALFKDPTRQWPVRLAGYIRNSGGEETLALARRSFAEGNSLFVFPEGTRTEPGRRPQFQKGAAQLAVRLGRDLLPVVVDATPSNLHKHGRFYWAPPARIDIRLRALPEVAVGPFLAARPGEPALAARDLNRHLQDLFNREL